MPDNTQTQQPDIINQLISGGISKQTQDQTSSGIQALMGLLQPTPDLQTANAALGDSTKQVLNNAADLSGNPNLAAGNYDATQNTGINQQQMAQALQSMRVSNTSSNSNSNTVPEISSNGSPLAPSQQIMQDVAKKAYTKQLQDHADNVPHPILGALLDRAAQSQNNNQNPIQAQQPNTQSNNQSSPPTDINTQIDNINKQTSLNIAKRNLSMSQPPNFWQRFGQSFAKQTGGITNTDNLANLSAGQKIAGQEPLQPKDIGELNAGSYKAALEATGTALTANQQKLTALTDLYGKEEQNKGIVASTLHNESPNQAVLRTAITNTADNMATHVKNFRDLIANRPTFNAQGLNTQTADIVNKTQQAKVGKYTLLKNSK